MQTINGKTKIIGFLGSRSQTSTIYSMYNAAFSHLQINYIYIPFIATDISQAVNGIRGLGIHAVGVSIPFKQSIIAYLDQLDEDAKQIGAVNFVLNQSGKLVGGNTDGKGALNAIKEVTNVTNKRILIIGAGGAARAIACALAEEGAQITIANRTPTQAKQLSEKVQGNYISLSDIPQLLPTTQILIQATSVGMNATDSLVDTTKLSSKCIVMDIIALDKTKLLLDAKQKGCILISGKRMLFWQGVLKFRKYTNMEPPLDIMEKTIYTEVY